jgi:hypothetical protein
MITVQETLLLNIIRKSLLGKQLPSNLYGDAGRTCENLLEDIGVPINRGAGCDILTLGWEVKSRKTNATSAQTITSMHPGDIISTPYRDSPVYEKIRKQLRFTSDESDVIIAIDLCDFDQDYIQDILEAGYERARIMIATNPKISYTPYQGLEGYFEKTKKDRPELDFRLADGQMEKFLAMTSSTFQDMFSYDC